MQPPLVPNQVLTHTMLMQTRWLQKQVTTALPCVMWNWPGVDTLNHWTPCCLPISLPFLPSDHLVVPTLTVPEVKEGTIQEEVVALVGGIDILLMSLKWKEMEHLWHSRKGQNTRLGVGTGFPTGAETVAHQVKVFTMQDLATWSQSLNQK